MERYGDELRFLIYIFGRRAYLYVLYRQRLSRVQAANQRRQELTLLQQKAQRMVSF